MIVFHSFFYKSHPRYLDRAVKMMEFVNNCGFIDHGDLAVFLRKLKEVLKEDSGGRYERGVIGVSHNTNGQIQIEVKNQQDYAAMIYYIKLEKGLSYRLHNEKLFQFYEFPSDDIPHLINKDVEI